MLTTAAFGLPVPLGYQTLWSFISPSHGSQKILVSKQLRERECAHKHVVAFMEFLASELMRVGRDRHQAFPSYHARKSASKPTCEAVHPRDEQLSPVPRHRSRFPDGPNRLPWWPAWLAANTALRMKDAGKTGWGNTGQPARVEPSWGGRLIQRTCLSRALFVVGNLSSNATSDILDARTSGASCNRTRIPVPEDSSSRNENNKP